MMQRWSGRNFTFVSNNNDSMVNYFLFSVLHFVPKSSIWKITNCSIQHETALIVGTIADKYLVLKTVRRNNVVIVWLVKPTWLKFSLLFSNLQDLLLIESWKVDIITWWPYDIMTLWELPSNIFSELIFQITVDI